MNIARNIAKLLRAFISLALMFGSFMPAIAGVRTQGTNLYTSTKLWSPLNFNNEWVALIDPYSVFKVSDFEWDVNITFLNNQNQYDPSQTFTYRIDCSSVKFKTQGWRINGVIKNYTDPYGLGLNFTKKSIPYGSIMWTAKEYVCGVSNSGATYYWAYSSFRNNQMRGAVDQVWFKDNVVTVSQDDRNLRRVSTMLSVLGGTQPSFSEFFVKCDKREWMEAVNGVSTADWSPVPAMSGIEVFYEKMCSNRFSFMTYQTNAITVPAPKPASETQEQQRSGAGLEEAKRKCSALGFAAGTPKFGQCVLKLSQ